VNEAHRSRCPINLSLEVFGDKWSLLILRDMIFGGRRHFRELLSGSQEGIASNILASRLKSLVEMGILSKRDDATHKQKVIYSLTEPAIELVPVMAQLGAWGSRWLPVTEELSVRARLLADGGPALWQRFMAELRAPPGSTLQAVTDAAHMPSNARICRTPRRAASPAPWPNSP